MLWLPSPPDGTQVAAGFDGSENHDFTAIKLETKSGLLFTPRYGPDGRATIWNPADWGGVIPRQQVRVAWSEIVHRYRLVLAYCDPGFHDETSWETEIESWQHEFSGGRPNIFVQWPTTSPQRMYPAIRRFEADLADRNKPLTHDGCPITTAHMGNAQKIAQRADRYTLGKPAQHQKIDSAVTSILAHEAACDARADSDSEWNKADELPPLVFGL